MSQSETGSIQPNPLLSPELPADLPMPRSRPAKEADTPQSQAAAKPNRFAKGFDWPVTSVLIGYHVLALAAPFFFSWTGLIVFLVLSVITGWLGITLCYHRLLTHDSFQTYRPIRWLLAFFGTLASEGSPIDWVATHRKHHQHSDQDDDPHSPEHGFWWSHMFWLFPWRDVEERQATHAHYAPDLLKDPVLRFLHKTHAMWFILMGVGLFASGWLIWDSWYMAMSLLCWGMFLRLVVVLNVTWAVNSATHIWGYRNYETKDNSRNLWWVGLLAGGEGWHNNHHACPRVAAHGQRWWEVDATYRMIWLMEKLGLAWNVVHKTHRVEKMLEQHRSQ